MLRFQVRIVSACPFPTQPLLHYPWLAGALRSVCVLLHASRLSLSPTIPSLKTSDLFYTNLDYV